MTPDQRSTFTPGPWWAVWSLTDEESGQAGGTPADVVVETATEAEFQPHDGEALPTRSILEDLTDADATLIAAAPELYESLRECVAALNNIWAVRLGKPASDPVPTDFFMARAKRALKKAMPDE
jgi:hypothetical protein